MRRACLRRVRYFAFHFYGHHMATTIGVPLLLLLACTGAGACVLALLGLWRERPRVERQVWAFALGMGVLGWLVFPLGVAGYLGTAPLLALCVLLALGNVLVLGPAATAEAAPLGTVGRLLLAVLCVVLAFDALEALAPPSEADSLAYHFALPKRFLAAGGLEFVPRAVDGAVPLLLHMTYLAALALGGEQALTIWAGFSGAAPAALLFVLARRFLPADWSLALVLLFLTTPTMVYGAGSGQVEARLAVFALAAVFLVGDSLRDGRLGMVVAAGLAAGIYAGSKYTGLLFLASCGLAVLFHRRWAVRGAVFAAAAVVAGGQWYLWNLWHSGDPVFPILHVWLGWDNPPLWPHDQSAYFREADLGARTVIPRTVWWLLGYPFRASLEALPQLGSGRIGLGPLGLLLIPFVAAGIWMYRRRVVSSPLFPAAAIVAVYYVLWFFLGGSQSLRHLLPVYPVFLLGAVYAAWRGAGRLGAMAPLLAAVGLTLAVQLGVHALFTKTPAAGVLRGESRQAFLLRTVHDFTPARWINGNLGPGDRILLIHRHLLYLLEVPYYYPHPAYQRLVDTRSTATDPEVFLAQLRAVGVTHVLSVKPPASVVAVEPGLEYLVSRLGDAGCLAPVWTGRGSAHASMTLPTVVYDDETYEVSRLDAAACPKSLSSAR